MRNNIVSFVPTSLLNKTLLLSYSRIIKPNVEVSIKTSLGIAEVKNPYHQHNEIGDAGAPPYHIFRDPSWYYNRFATQVGFLRQYYNWFVEPMLQYEYGYFTNQTLIIHDTSGDDEDVFWRLDRKYHGIGCSLYTGLCFDFNRFRFKLFGGLVYNFKFYQEKIYEKWNWEPNFYTFYTNIDNTVTKYTKNRVGAKIGIELGFRF